VKHRFAVRAGAFLFILLLVSAGRWVAFTGAELTPLSCILIAGSYGLIAAGIAFFTIDLVLVRSLLQRKILCIRIFGIALIALAVVDRVFTLSGLTAAISLFLSAALFVLLIVLDTLGSGRPDFRTASADHLPARYLRRRPIKTAVETLLRLFPFPEPVGLYRIGSAGADSPVLVTGNFELTLRRVCSALHHRFRGPGH